MGGVEVQAVVAEGGMETVAEGEVVVVVVAGGGMKRLAEGEVVVVVEVRGQRIEARGRWRGSLWPP